MAATKTLLLAGGGHAHCIVLRHFAAAPPPRGWRVRLISDSALAVYSGMMPGAVAGVYPREECFINLPKLCARAGAEFSTGAVNRIDAAARRVYLTGDNENEARYDILSINIGALPPPLFDSSEKDARAIVPLKPIASFLDWLSSAPLDGARIVIVGGGAGGVEIALALRRRAPKTLRLAVVDSSPCLLPQFPPAFQKMFLREFEARDISFIPGKTICRIEKNTAHFSEGGEVAGDFFIAATPARAPKWLQQSGLPLNPQGFLRARDTLQIEEDAQIFAAGDVSVTPQNLPRAGVFAVRQGPLLAGNLQAAMRGDVPRLFQTRPAHLAIIGNYHGEAAAAFGGLCARGRWVWHWKRYLDLRFMRSFQI